MIAALNRCIKDCARGGLAKHTGQLTELIIASTGKLSLTPQVMRKLQIITTAMTGASCLLGWWHLFTGLVGMMGRTGFLGVAVKIQSKFKDHTVHLMWGTGSVWEVGRKL